MNFSQPEIESRQIFHHGEQKKPACKRAQSDNYLVDFLVKKNEGPKLSSRQIQSQAQLDDQTYIQLLNRFAEMGYAPEFVKFLLGKFSGKLTRENQEQVSEILIKKMSQIELQQQQDNLVEQEQQLIQFTDMDQMSFHQVIMFQEEQGQEVEKQQQLSLVSFDHEEVVSHKSQQAQGVIIATENDQIIQIEINPKQECQICMDGMDIEFLIPTCNHFFCYQCVVSYLENMVRSGNVINIKCPKDGCTQEVTPQTISNLLTDDLNEKYLKFKKKKEVDMDPTKRWCPRIGCDNYVSVEQCQGQRATCVCGTDICFRCGSFYHEGQSCEGAIDFKFHKAVEEFKIKSCPQCHAPILKNSGCNHMTCYNCKYQFCWLCLKKYVRSHYKFFNFRGCPYFKAQFTNDAPVNPLHIQLPISVLIRLLCILLITPFMTISIFLCGFFFSLRKHCKFTKCLKSMRRSSMCCYCIFCMFQQIILFILLPFTFLFYGLPHSIKKFCVKVFFPS